MEREANLGKREADALIQVHRKDGKEAWVLVHVEVQAQKDPDFPLRLFVSNYRIFDLFRKPVCSLAILADKSRTWHPNSYSNALWGITMSLQFSSRKLQDFNNPEELAKLEKSTNPFAHLVAATLYAQTTRPHSKERESKKYHLVRNLYRLGLSKEQIRHFFKLIDWVLTLSPPLSKVFQAKIRKFEEENRMPYITSIEQLGREEGREEGLRTSVLNVLKARFDQLPENLLRKIEVVKSTETLNRLTISAATAETLEEFEDGLF